MKWACAVVLGLAVVVVTGTAGAQETGIPQVRATAFSGDAVILPDGLKGRTGVLVIGFSQASRAEVTSWGKRLAAEYRSDPTVLYYEMPVLASVPRLMRGFVLDRIKADVPERARPRFVPILTDEGDWKRVVQFRRPDDAYVLVVDSKGSIRLREQGPPSDASYQEIRNAIETSRSTGTR